MSLRHLASIVLVLPLCARASGPHNFQAESARRRATSLTSSSGCSRWLRPPAPPIARRSRNGNRTQLSTAAFIDPTAVATALGSFARQSPYATAFLVCAVKGAAADFVAQSSEAVERERNAGTVLALAVFISLPPPRKNDGYDFRRGLTYVLYGGLYQGVAIEFLYNDVFGRMFGDCVLAKLAFAQLVLSPFVTLPVAYIIKGIVYGKTLRGAMKEYWKDVTEKGLLLAFWKIWTPVNFLLFSVVPEHLRISFSAVVSFVWMVIFSRIANSPPKRE